jgi:uroporphyrinogen decarboxylase
MTSRERVLRAIRFEKPDRVPLDIWIIDEVCERMLEERYGGIDAFLDALGTDAFMAFSSMPKPPDRQWQTIDEVLDTEFLDPDDRLLYTQAHKEVRYPRGIVESVEEHGRQRGRAVIGWVVGPYEALQGFLGTESALMEMALNREKVAEFMRRLGEWSHRVASNMIDLGVDIILISDDWGQNQTMLFSPRDWMDLVRPAVARIAEAALRRGLPVALHSDGYIEPVLEELVRIGIRVIHPLQETAGMDQLAVRRKYGQRLCFYGGLDVRLLSQVDADQARQMARSKVEQLGKDGGLILCTSHSVSPEIPLENVLAAYEEARGIALG